MGNIPKLRADAELLIRKLEAFHAFDPLYHVTSRNYFMLQPPLKSGEQRRNLRRELDMALDRLIIYKRDLKNGSKKFIKRDEYRRLRGYIEFFKLCLELAKKNVNRQISEYQLEISRIIRRYHAPHSSTPGSYENAMKQFELERNVFKKPGAIKNVAGYRCELTEIRLLLNKSNTSVDSLKKILWKFDDIVAHFKHIELRRNKKAQKQDAYYSGITDDQIIFLDKIERIEIEDNGESEGELSATATNKINAGPEIDSVDSDDI